ncbi:S1C family serine protease [Deinococcus malanensis]|uniref:S1C family serine protease n=1 Tax=Deinococcus malanensis TaxID=1706855 RepID=UPI0036268D54
MKRPLFATTLVLVGLGLGATLLRDQVPPGTAQPADVPQAERAARLENEQNTMSIVRRYEPGLVFISTEQQVVRQDPMGWMFGGDPETQVQQGIGSGFFVNKAGDILTNYHVIAAQSPTGAAERITIRLMGREESVPARVIGLAPQYDLALLRAEKLDPKLITPIPLGNSDTLAVGQKAVAMGAPFGLDFSVTEGIVSSTARTIPIGFNGAGEGIMQRAIQTDAAINPGNSGGPLLDSSGKVIGINTQIISPGVQAGGWDKTPGWALPFRSTRPEIFCHGCSRQGGVVSAPRLGVSAGLIVQSAQGAVAAGLSALSSSAKQDLDLPETGLVIGEVAPGSPAARAGLRGARQTQAFRGGEIALGSDVIVQADGKVVDALEDLQSALLDKQEGDQVKLQVVRGGERREVKVTLDASAFE